MLIFVLVASSCTLVPRSSNINASATSSVQVFFTTKDTGTEPDFDCAKVASVTRVIPRTEALARAALEELLKGPTSAEVRDGYATSLPGGDIKIESLAITNGIAAIDFNEALQDGVAGSCRVTSIRSQIEHTLRQFPTVESVVISIKGNSDSILQP